jgi:hypothetical protein
MGLLGLLKGQFYLLYVDYVRTSQETHLLASTACYGYSLSFYSLRVKCLYCMRSTENGSSYVIKTEQFQMFQ